MENFKRLTLEDKNLFIPFEKSITTKSYEYSFTSLYLWRNLSQIKYAIIDDCIIINKFEEPFGNFFMMPFGYKKTHLQSLVENLKSISPTNNIYLFGDIEDSFISDLYEYTNFSYEIINDRNDYEYIYSTEDLINLKGKKYHKKKNHYNCFTNLYNYKVCEIDSSEKIDDCINLLKKWHDNRCICCNELLIEINEIRDILFNIKELDLKSIGVYVDNELVGFSIGELFKDTAIIHVERCNKNYNGVYSFINREFLIKDFSSTTFVNRQEDCGCEGLRKAKSSYYPVELLKKSLIVI